MIAIMMVLQKFSLTPALSRWERENVKDCSVKSASFQAISSRRLVLLLALVLLGSGLTVFGADDATPGFRGDGLCRFALNQYALPKVNEDKINLIVADLLKRHEAAFNFTASPDLHVRIRIFGTFEG